MFILPFARRDDPLWPFDLSRAYPLKSQSEVRLSYFQYSGYYYQYDFRFYRWRPEELSLSPLFVHSLQNTHSGTRRPKQLSLSPFLHTLCRIHIPALGGTGMLPSVE